MIYVILSAWVACALLIVLEQRIARIIIYLAIFSLISSVAYLFLGAPDVAMAEATASVFTTVFFIICFEKYFSRAVPQAETMPAPGMTATKKTTKDIFKTIVPIVFTVFLFVLVLFLVYKSGGAEINLRELYLTLSEGDFGSENVVTAIYLGYRVYDTLFEALVLVISVVAVMHMSHFQAAAIKSGEPSEVEKDGMAVFAIRIICPAMLLFGLYLILNGHISPGGGFQGGLAIATYFICRYMIYDVYDLPIRKLIRLEEMVFAAIVVFAVILVFWGFISYLPPQMQPVVKTIHMVAMNALIGLKVACGFIILFYRYIAVERN